MVDLLYYRNVIETQNDPETLKFEMNDLINDIEWERKESFSLGDEIKTEVEVIIELIDEIQIENELLGWKHTANVLSELKRKIRKQFSV